MREWCVSHLTHLALSDAFGSSVDPNKTKKKSDMRSVLTKCRKIIEKVNKSEWLKESIELHMQRNHGKVVKLKNSPAHRWSAMEEVLLRVLKFWNQINKGFLECNLPFTIANERKLILELRSIIHPIQHIQRMAQKMKGLCVRPFLVFFQILFPQCYIAPVSVSKFSSPRIQNHFFVQFHAVHTFSVFCSNVAQMSV
jgi:hypothetical protein